MTPFGCGKRPVTQAARLGLHSGEVQKALEKSKPSEARRSLWGGTSFML